jgi:hypothetical protein
MRKYQVRFQEEREGVTLPPYSANPREIGVQFIFYNVALILFIVKLFLIRSILCGPLWFSRALCVTLPAVYVVSYHLNFRQRLMGYQGSITYRPI